MLKNNVGEPVHTLISGWMPKPLSPRNQCTGWFAPTLKNPLGAGWGSLPTLQWAGSWLPTYVVILSRKVERRFHNGNQTTNHSIRKWASIHYHPVV